MAEDAKKVEIGVLSFDHSASHHDWMAIDEELSPPIRAANNRQPAVLAFDETQITSDTNRSNPQPGDPCHPLAAGARPPLAICLTGEVTHSLTHEGHDASDEAREAHTIVASETGQGWWTEGTPAASLRANPGGMPSHIASAGIPRRLTPRECERLQSWPDDHTLVPNKSGKPMSDSARYKMAGNGVASVCAQWIGWRLALALEP